VFAFEAEEDDVEVVVDEKVIEVEEVVVVGVVLGEVGVDLEIGLGMGLVPVVVVKEEAPEPAAPAAPTDFKEDEGDEDNTGMAEAVELGG